MSGACVDPIPWGTLVDYWADDVSASDKEAIEEHLFACASCSKASARVASITEAIRSMIAPVILDAELELHRARGLRVAENPMQPGDRREVFFAADIDLLIHRLEGLELEDVKSIDFLLRDERSGRVITTVSDVPFDRDAGCVLVACQRLYAGLPPDTVAELSLDRGTGSATRVVYTMLHRY